MRPDIIFLDQLAAQADAATKLAKRGLILFPAAQGPTMHAQILDAFAVAGVKLPRVQEAARALTMLSLVSAGEGGKATDAGSQSA